MVQNSDKYLEKTLKILKIFGTFSGTYVPNPEQSTTNYFARFKKFYDRFVVLVISFMIVCCYPYILDHWENSSEIAQSLATVIVATQTVVKIFLFNYYKSDIFDLIQKAKYFRSAKILTERELEISKNCTKKSLGASLGFLIMYSAVFVLSAIAPVIQEDKLLPLAIQIPFVPPYESPFLETNYVYQVLAAMYFTISVAVSDAVYVFLINEGCLQLDIIEEKLSHIGEDSEGAENEEEEELQFLREIHVLHTAVNKYFNKVNKLFSLMLMVQFFCSTYGISFTIFSIVKSLKSEKLSMLLAYFFQIYALSIHGEQTTIKMANMVQALYTNKWYNLGPRTKKSLMIMMSCSQPQYQLSAGGFIDLTLKTFLAIMKTAYSYYALMNST